MYFYSGIHQSRQKECCILAKRGFRRLRAKDKRGNSLHSVQDEKSDADIGLMHDSHTAVEAVPPG